MGYKFCLSSVISHIRGTEYINKEFITRPRSLLNFSLATRPLLCDGRMTSLELKMFTLKHTFIYLNKTLLLIGTCKSDCMLILTRQLLFFQVNSLQIELISTHIILFHIPIILIRNSAKDFNAIHCDYFPTYTQRSEQDI